MMTSIEDKTIINNSSYVFDASSSWNGFNHQGKLAMYEVLKLMSSLSDFELSSYELEIEHLEDFSILKNRKHLTVHQVKSYKDNSAKTHTKAIWNLLGIMNDFPSVTNSYLHVTSEISDLDNLKSILKRNMDNFSVDNENSIEKGIKKKSAIECMIDVKKSNNFERLFKKFEVYEYPNKNKFCRLNEIDNLLKEQIIISKKGKNTHEDIKRTFFHILGLIDNNIRENHHNIQNASIDKREKISISFTEIYKVLNAKYEHFSLEFASFLLKNEFGRIVREYLDKKDLSFKHNGIAEEEYKNTLIIVKNIFAQVNKLSSEEFIDFCLIINPTNQINKDAAESTPDLLRLISQDNIEQSFLEALKHIKIQLIEGKWIHTFKNELGENINYLPSTIINSNKLEEHIMIIEKILNNSHNDFLMEVDVIITKEISNIKLSQYNGAITKNVEDPDRTEAEKNYYEKINKIKDIKMINLDEASEDFKND